MARVSGRLSWAAWAGPHTPHGRIALASRHLARYNSPLAPPPFGPRPEPRRRGHPAPAALPLRVSRDQHASGPDVPGSCREASPVRSHPEAETPQLPFTDPAQYRYELIRPLLLVPECTATQRAQETGTHPETVGRLKRRFEQQGMLGLLPDTLDVSPASRRLRVPDTVVHELQRLKGLYAGFGSRELARIIFHTTMHRLTGQTAQRLWERLPPATPPPRPLLDYHSHPERAHARMEVITLYAQGWSKRSISQFLQVSRPTINTWIARFEADNLASLEDRSRAPKTPVRKAWLSAMVEIYHLQKRHPDAGGFRIWSLRGKTDLSVRTVERIMALNRQVYKDIPGTEWQRAPKAAPQPHPFKASAAHEYWFIDGRMMDFALEGHRWWSLIILDGYSRTMLAGAVAPSEASWVALTVLYTACQRYGVPVHLISDSGGAFISDAFEGVCTRLGIDHKTIVSTEGQSYQNLMVTVERRIAPPPAVPERSVPVSEHSAPQCPDAGHAYRAGESPHAPASSHRGSVHAALGGSSRVHGGDRHRYDLFQSDPQSGRTAHRRHSAPVAV